MQLTSSVWPTKLLMGLSSPTLAMWIVLSEELVAKMLLLFQSTSNMGAVQRVRLVFTFFRNFSLLREDVGAALDCMHAFCSPLERTINLAGYLLQNFKARDLYFAAWSPEWKENCCLIAPALAFHTMAVRSKLPVSKRSPFLFHFKENIGPA